MKSYINHVSRHPRPDHYVIPDMIGDLIHVFSRPSITKSPENLPDGPENGT